MHLTQPAFLCVLGLVPWVVLLGRRASWSRSAQLVRVASLTSLVLAAAGLKVRGPDVAASVVIAVDRSDSVERPDQLRAMSRAVALASNMRESDRVAVVDFGSNAVIDQALAARAPDARVTSTITGSGTNIEAALRLAVSVLPSEGLRRVVLLSDGVETTGDAVREAALAGAAGVAVDVVPVGGHSPRLRAVKLTAPADVRIGEPFHLGVELAGPPGEAGRVDILRNGSIIDTEAVTLDQAGAARVSIDRREMRPGPATFSAGVSDAGGAATAEAGVVVMVSGTPAVLYAGRRGEISRVLASEHYAVTNIPPHRLPSSIADCRPYDIVILDDVPAEELSAAQTRTLSEFVEQEGGGLLVLGGPHSLGPAGYSETAIGAALPIDLRKRRGTAAPGMALVVVFDKSGSMADSTSRTTKIELARRAVMAVLQVVPRTDLIGVLAFDAAPTAVVPLAPGPDADDVRNRLRHIEPSGATAMAPAVETAREWLRQSGVARRQILLISDGRSSEDDAARLMEMASERDVKLSIIAIGTDVDRTFFERLAAKSDGQVFFPADLSRLPEVVAREASRASGPWRVQERFALRAPSAHAVLTDIDRAALPTLDEYTVAEARPNADVVLSSDRGDPILSTWRFGLGRVAVFNATMSPAFQAWPEFGRLWTQAARWLGRGRDSTVLRGGINSTERGAQLLVEAIMPDGRYANGLRGEATVRTAAGEMTSVPFRQTAPGVYEAYFVPRSRGTYVATLSLRDTRENEYRTIHGLYWTGTVEQTDGTIDVERLDRIARASGGRRLGDHDMPFAEDRPAGYRDLSQVLATTALFLFVLDVALRRNVGRAVGEILSRLTPSVAKLAGNRRHSKR